MCMLRRWRSSKMTIAGKAESAVEAWRLCFGVRGDGWSSSSSSSSVCRHNALQNPYREDEVRWWKETASWRKTKAVEDLLAPPTDVVDVTYPIALFLGVGVGFAVARLIVYLRLQYIAANANLRIFQQGARVLEYDCVETADEIYITRKT